MDFGKNGFRIRVINSGVIVTNMLDLLREASAYLSGGGRMKGSYQVRVSRRRGTSFRFEVKRNITVVRGDSGTGKTTLYDMIADHMRLGDRSIAVSSLVGNASFSTI